MSLFSKSEEVKKAQDRETAQKTLSTMERLVDQLASVSTSLDNHSQALQDHARSLDAQRRVSEELIKSLQVLAQGIAPVAHTTAKVQKEVEEPKQVEVKQPEVKKEEVKKETKHETKTYDKKHSGKEDK